MVRFVDAVVVWGKLLDTPLQSVRPGAELVIRKIDHEAERIVVEGASGTRSRPYSELRRLWDVLVRESIVHVDSVLGGSGSSRNQPETLLANLPWVQWAIVDRKKHLVFDASTEHPPGTLLRVLPEQLLTVQERSRRRTQATAELVVAVADIAEAARLLAQLTGQSALVSNNGGYTYAIGALILRVVPADASAADGDVALLTSLFNASGIAASIRLGSHLILKPEPE